jgi:hypothetical protein
MIYDLMNVTEIKNDIQMYDLLSIDWTSFEYINGFETRILSQQDIESFWNVSYEYFGTVKFEDILLRLNNIENPFELKIANTIYIPKEEDLKNFILKNTKKR